MTKNYIMHNNIENNSCKIEVIKGHIEACIFDYYAKFTKYFHMTFLVELYILIQLHELPFELN